MAVLTSYKDKQVLIIDDLPDARSSLRNQIGSLNISEVGLVSNVRDALDLIRIKKYDVILCDYYLAGATDGQQFLEYLRNNNLISRATLFIMITAETGYESVITAAECLPDDYLLKPFTAETLRSRIERLLEKKSRLARIDKLQDHKDWAEIIFQCNEIIASKDKYLIDAMRIKGNALLMSNQFDAAIDFYQHALSLRVMPWAKLGLAKALRSKGDLTQAKQLLGSLISENPQFLSAYDMLGQIHTESGENDAALEILDNACKVAPNSLTRQRHISQIAEETGDFKRVEQALSTVIRKTKNSPLRATSDFARLGNALTETGDAAKAIAVIEEAKSHFKENQDIRLLAAVEAFAQNKAGKAELAEKALTIAMTGEIASLPESTSFSIAKACLSNNREDAAMEILKTVIQNNPQSNNILSRLGLLLKDHGGLEIARELITTSSNEVILLNNEAVGKAKAGQYAEAAKMLTEAAVRLPNNLQIVSNAAFSLLAEVFMNGLDNVKLSQAKAFQQSVMKANSEYPKLTEIASLLQKIHTKYKLEKTP